MLSENNRLFQISNKSYYAYKRNNWMLDPTLAMSDFSEVVIDRPIFLLGTHGGGLTLISRMLRRNDQVISVTGDKKYWAGADEMQVVLEPVLPQALKGINQKESDDDIFGKRREWVYATDHLLPDYRKTERDVTDEDRERFLKILKWTIKRQSKGSKWLRFTDKSQLFSVKVSYISSLLQGCGPKFILVTRNPYAICFSKVNGIAGLRNLKNSYTFEQRLEFAAQHWANSMTCALEDGKEADNLMVIRFEDVLTEPEIQLNAISKFVEITFSEDMLPQSVHSIPFGSLRRDRWYPLRTDVNDRHLSKLSNEHVEIIYQTCGKLADQFGYEKPL